MTRLMVVMGVADTGAPFKPMVIAEEVEGTEAEGAETEVAEGRRAVAEGAEEGEEDTFLVDDDGGGGGSGGGEDDDNNEEAEDRGTDEDVSTTGEAMKIDTASTSASDDAAMARGMSPAAKAAKIMTRFWRWSIAIGL